MVELPALSTTVAVRVFPMSSCESRVEEEELHVVRVRVDGTAVSVDLNVFALNETEAMVSDSPDVVVLQAYVWVSPYLNAPLVPVAPEAEREPAVTTGTMVSMV